MTELKSKRLTKKELKKIGKLSTCENCGNINGMYMIEPYDKAKYNKENLVCLCDTCRQNNIDRK